MKSKMNKLYLFLASVAAAGMMLCAPAARADQIANWQLALPGGPLNSGINNLSFNGASSIVNTLMPDNSFSFTDTGVFNICLLYTSPSPRDGLLSRMPSSA